MVFVEFAGEPCKKLRAIVHVLIWYSACKIVKVTMWSIERLFHNNPYKTFLLIESTRKIVCREFNNILTKIK